MERNLLTAYLNAYSLPLTPYRLRLLLRLLLTAYSLRLPLTPYRLLLTAYPLTLTLTPYSNKSASSGMGRPTTLLAVPDTSFSQGRSS